MTQLRQRNFLDFAGPGIAHPSESMRIGDGEAAVIRAGLTAASWSAPVWMGRLRHGDYAIRHATSDCATGLFRGDELVGFYAGSYLWIARPHRGKGLSLPLILATADSRGGTVLPPGVVVQGYTAAGLAAHRSAFAWPGKGLRLPGPISSSPSIAARAMERNCC